MQIIWQKNGFHITKGVNLENGMAILIILLIMRITVQRLNSMRLIFIKQQAELSKVLVSISKIV